MARGRCHCPSSLKHFNCNMLQALRIAPKGRKSPKGKVKGWNHTEWGDQFPVDVPVEQARAENYDALLLPEGVMNPDELRRTSSSSSSCAISSAPGNRSRRSAMAHGR